MELTRQRRVWDCIKQHGPIGAQGIAEYLGFEKRHVTWHIGNLKKYTKIEMRGKGKAAQYTLGPGAKYACVGKGGHPNSKKNLELRDWRTGFKYLIPGPKHKRPVPQTALEEAWGWGLEKTTMDWYKRRREGAP